MRANFAIDLEQYRKHIEAGGELSIWEKIIAGDHPAHGYPWKDEHVKQEAIKNTIANKNKASIGHFYGLVTTIKRKFDKHDNEMAWIGLLGAKKHIEVTCFGSQWSDIKPHIKMGTFVRMRVKKQADNYRGRGFSYLYDDDYGKVTGIRLLNKSAVKTETRKE
jgi:DNA polymerase III alpha subunit